ncbi:LysR family transcriptional regulator [Paenibacillus sp. FSL R7-0337]|uniref:LysR family transcriptional regulator n=1 Tax=Paenibacillus sp. FSL R7-0337 TaxID=1926588 RepID=UPI00096F3EC1|nr:LysR family transcriptional regulator [Paenibacillus sp. FSL R7-0337]OMG00866.1 LysR family transcriptional regulator [Paenibacillus sp. FSL R7-0337]
MDLKTLKTFHLIVQYGSFNRAAQEMNYAQSTVTMQIQKLESELGVKLIERGKEIRLTEAGRLFHEQSLQITKNMEYLQTSLSNLKSGDSGHIRIGVTEPTASYRLPGVLRNFMTEHPNVRISVEISNTPTLKERVLQGEIDFALSTVPDLGSELHFEPLFQEEFAVLMPENHPLAQKEVIVPEEFQGYRLLITSATCPYRRKLEMVLQESGNLMLDTMEIGSMTALKHYVENGLGIALVPKIMIEPETSGTTVRMVSGSLISMTFGILCKASAYPLQLASGKLYQQLKLDLKE